jgi:hypothetical protein
MKATLVTIGLETDSHSSDIEMFKVYKEVEVLIAPVLRHHILTEDGDDFLVEKIEQNLKDGKVILYYNFDIPHHEFWGDKKRFRQKYLPSFLKRGWKEI